ncbi:FecR family protein [Mucilaginibacter jinjuensis]|uniref:FecR domain-containing protein n=1 Tax=Mucilaginibacter jinjuensis TaxID=1176721 RepID=A0ABY7T721_9SPHI|nr:FecR domain-containing protein [Mucilaginibacter jinjuensis]WCT12078.1 FecR domain-containing protein [Mucilaginibacter jinjuensis]
MGLNELKLLAKKYLNGTASAEEKERINQWYEAIYAGDAEEVDTNETEAEIKRRIFENIRQRMQESAAPAAVINPKYNVKQLWLRVAYVAAVLAIVCYCIWPAGKVAVKEVEKQVVNVPANRVLHVTLPDGSRVWLNVGSIFKYPKSFSGKTRMVELVDGRAFFDIRHDDKHPFIVKTRRVNITVLGTSFDVSNYKKDGQTRVSVVTGKVGVSLTNRSKDVLMLLPQQQIVLSNITNQLIKEPVHEAMVNAWCKNSFVFEQESLANVFNALEKEYNTKITVENKELLNERISIKLGNQHLDTIMEILSFTKHFKYQIANDSTVVVK